MLANVTSLDAAHSPVAYAPRFTVTPGGTRPSKWRGSIAHTPVVTRLQEGSKEGDE